MSPSARSRLPGGVPPLSINTGNLGSGSVHDQGHRPTTIGSGKVPGVTQGVGDGEGTQSILKSPVESSLLASIRESGGLAGLRRTGGIRSPPPREKLISYASSSSLAHGGGGQGDLVSALVEALHRRQTKMSYSDDEDEPSDDEWDVDD
ncbi:hypothetical protein BGZ92_007489 [Podila epicladia]|nr:hypothetical protein BGZ92_007489 [Podila epicladia]